MFLVSSDNGVLVLGSVYEAKEEKSKDDTSNLCGMVAEVEKGGGQR